MKHLIIIILAFLAISTKAQLVEKNLYDSLVIVDEFNSNYSLIFGRIYKIYLNDSIPKLILTKEYKNTDSIHPYFLKRIPQWSTIENNETNKPISEIDPALIEELVNIINNPSGLQSILNYFEIDSIWHLSNKERLLDKWLTRNEESDKLEKLYASYVLNDYSQFKRMAYHHVLQRNSSNYNSIAIAFENLTDTLIFSTQGQESFLLPWVSDSTYKNYNPELSNIISRIIPQKLIINKYSLSPSIEKFEDGILEELTFKVKFIDRKAFKRFIKNYR